MADKAVHGVVVTVGGTPVIASKSFKVSSQNSPIAVRNSETGAFAQFLEGQREITLSGDFDLYADGETWATAQSALWAAHTGQDEVEVIVNGAGGAFNKTATAILPKFDLDFDNTLSSAASISLEFQTVEELTDVPSGP